MKAINKWKYFWTLNYLLSIYKCIYLFIITLQINGLKFDYHFNKFIPMGGFIFLFLYMLEWVQIPLCLIIALLIKTERTLFHFIYIFFLFLLSISTYFLFALILGSMGDM